MLAVFVPVQFSLFKGTESHVSVFCAAGQQTLDAILNNRSRPESVAPLMLQYKWYV